MINRKLGTIGIAVLVTVLIPLTNALVCASEKAQMTPEFAAKKENFRKQNEQRITHDKRKAAAEALKAERVRVYRAKQAVKQATPPTVEIK